MDRILQCVRRQSADVVYKDSRLLQCGGCKQPVWVSKIAMVECDGMIPKCERCAPARAVGNMPPRGNT